MIPPEFETKRRLRELPVYVRELCRKDFNQEMNSYVNDLEKQLGVQIRINGALLDDLEAMENRCKVAEDLNKIYVRMYLEMQQKYDDLAKREWDCCGATCISIEDL